MWELIVTGYLPRSPNAAGRKHWGQKMSERLFWQAALGEQAYRGSIPRATGRRLARIELERKGGTRLRDKDNLWASVKHLLDAMTSLELIVDDAKEWLDLVSVEESNGFKQYKTIIHLEETT